MIVITFLSHYDFAGGSRAGKDGSLNVTDAAEDAPIVHVVGSQVDDDQHLGATLAGPEDRSRHDPAPAGSYPQNWQPSLSAATSTLATTKFAADVFPDAGRHATAVRQSKNAFNSNNRTAFGVPNEEPAVSAATPRHDVAEPPAVHQEGRVAVTPPVDAVVGEAGPVESTSEHKADASSRPADTGEYVTESTSSTRDPRKFIGTNRVKK
jgi:hypothetical protein